MLQPNMLYKICENRLLSEDNDNDYYFIQYLAYILKYIERKNSNPITIFGLKSVEFNIMSIYTKLVNESQEEEKVTQNELIIFCLYMSNANKICEKMENVITLYKKDKNGFRENSKLPDCVLDDFIRFEDRIHNLSIMYNKIAHLYSDSLGLKHTSVYNKKKKISFLQHNTII
jgi:hypothetical protein